MNILELITKGIIAAVLIFLAGPLWGTVAFLALWTMIEWQMAIRDNKDSRPK